MNRSSENRNSAGPAPNAIVYLALLLEDGTLNVDPGGSIPGLCDSDEFDRLDEHVRDPTGSSFVAQVRLCNGRPRRMTAYRDDTDPSVAWVVIDSL